MINKTKIFIPFIEGTLNYNCQECGYQCCKSTERLVVNEREKKLLFKKYPWLKYFFIKRRQDLSWIKVCARCWFLEKNGLCGLQKNHGYSFKPFLCRLHPFYAARCGGEYIMLPRLCPGLYVDQGHQSKNFSYQQILKNAREAIDYGYLYILPKWPKKRLSLERKILTDSKLFLGQANYLDFAAQQMSLAKQNQNMAKIKSELLAAVKLWQAFFAIDELNLENRKLTYELTAITALLRTGHPRLWQLEAGQAPVALLALYFYAILFSSGRRIKTYVTTYEEILDNVALNLLLLEKTDLQISRRPLEEKLGYLHQLGKIYARRGKADVI